MLVRELNLAYKDKCSFVLDDTLSVKLLRFEDLLQDKAIQDGGDDDEDPGRRFSPPLAA